jgi:type II secretory pathway component PulF
LKSGLPLAESLEICANTLPNEVYKKCLILTKSNVERGEKIGKSFKNFPKVFPYIFSQMILVAERSGMLDETLSYQSKFYEEKVTADLKRISRIIEPSLIIFVGAIVAFIAISIISTIYKFISQFRPG